MKSTSEGSKIQISTATYHKLQEVNKKGTKNKFVMEKRGEVAVKGKGTMETYWLMDCLHFEPELQSIDRIMQSQRSLAAVATNSVSDISSQGASTTIFNGVDSSPDLNRSDSSSPPSGNQMKPNQKSSSPFRKAVRPSPSSDLGGRTGV
jgi:hypothetical protein